MPKVKKEQYPLKLVPELMAKARESAIKADIPFNQWLRDAIKVALKIK